MATTGSPEGTGESAASVAQTAEGLIVARASDPGCVRTRNEDAVLHQIPSEGRLRARKGLLFLVADGMGGHLAGEVASRRAVELVAKAYYTDSSRLPGSSLVRAFEAANQAIYELAQADPGALGMGTTLVGAVIVGRRVYVANVGDSRAYLIGPAGIAQITDDHSWVEEQVRAGLLKPDQAHDHPRRNLVTRAIGTRPVVEVDLFEGEIRPGDSLLLCSDGLSGPVRDDELEAYARSSMPEEAVSRLVDLAKERGGNDNISVVIVRQGAAGAPAEQRATARKRRRWIAALAAAALLILLALLIWQGPSLLQREASLSPTSTPAATLTLSAGDLEGTGSAATAAPLASLTPPP